MERKPYYELYDEETLEEKVNLLYKRCQDECDCDCSVCKFADNFDSDDECTVEIVMELWRRWKNLKEAN